MVIKKEIKVKNILNIEIFKKNSIYFFCKLKIPLLWFTPVYTLKTNGLE